MRLAITLCALVSIGCTQPEIDDAGIEYSESWFACAARFDCVVVFDAFCKHVAVNSKYTLIYQDWTRQQVRREGMRVVCSDPVTFAGGAGCRKGRCVYPFGLEDYIGGPKDQD